MTTRRSVTFAARQQSLSGREKRTVSRASALGKEVKRESGYYWISFDTPAPFIAYWCGSLKEWLLVGDWECLHDGPRLKVLSERLMPPGGE